VIEPVARMEPFIAYSANVVVPLLASEAKPKLSNPIVTLDAVAFPKLISRIVPVGSLPVVLLLSPLSGQLEFEVAGVPGAPGPPRTAKDTPCKDEIDVDGAYVEKSIFIAVSALTLVATVMANNKTIEVCLIFIG